MTIDEFDKLSEEKKGVIIFDADKISEGRDDFIRCELFTAYDFFIETKTSIRYNWKRNISTHTINNIPLKYAADVQKRLLKQY